MGVVIASGPGCHSSHDAPLLAHGQIVGRDGHPVSAHGFVILDPDASRLSVGETVRDPSLSGVNVGTDGVVSVRVGFDKDVRNELRRSGPTLNFTLVLTDSAGGQEECGFSRTADATGSPTTWTDSVPELRITADHGCNTDTDGRSSPTANTVPASTP